MKNKLFNFSEFIKENYETPVDPSTDAPVDTLSTTIEEPIKSKEDEIELPLDVTSPTAGEGAKDVIERVDLEYSGHIFSRLLERSLMEELCGKEDEVEVKEMKTKEDEVEVKEMKTKEDEVEVKEMKTKEDEVEVKEMKTKEDEVEFAKAMESLIRIANLENISESMMPKLPKLSKGKIALLGIAGFLAYKRIKKMKDRIKTANDLVKDIQDPKKKAEELKKVKALRGSELDAIKELRDKADKAEALYKVADAKTKEKMRMEKAKAQEELAKIY